jgi:hypothetical protein
MNFIHLAAAEPCQPCTDWSLEFARARVEMKAIATVLHLPQQAPRRLKSMVPDHVWALIKPYGLAPQTDEQFER